MGKNTIKIARLVSFLHERPRAAACPEIVGANIEVAAFPKETLLRADPDGSILKNIKHE
jgi:hypothetical protein